MPTGIPRSCKRCQPGSQAMSRRSLIFVGDNHNRKPESHVNGRDHGRPGVVLLLYHLELFLNLTKLQDRSFSYVFRVLWWQLALLDLTI
jgi:hypothetical protein